MAPNEKTYPFSASLSRLNSRGKVSEAGEDVSGDIKRFHFSYKPLKDNPLRRMSIYQWIKGKIKDDAIGADLWRVGDSVYDLSNFVDKHPGGAEWLELSKGTDITEAFHTCHIFSDRVKAILAKYRVGSCADIPRNSPFTFHPDGFYCRLRTRVADVLKDVGTAPTLKMCLMADAILLAFHILLILTAISGSYLLAVLTGLVLGMNVSCAHNFLHQRDNIRRWYLDVAAFNSSDWRMVHFLSHHLFTNTYNDFEVQSMYPLLDFNATEKKNLFHRYIGPFFYQIAFVSAGPLSFINKMALIFLGDCKMVPLDLMPVAQYILMLLVSPYDDWTNFFLLTIIHGFSGWWVSFTALIATHHTPIAFHMGDDPLPNRDWGLQQLDSVRDVSGKNESLFLVATTFGDHLLHHLFPVVDHSKLGLLYPALEETLKEFGLKYEFEHWWPMLKGIHQQLARNYGTTYQERTALRVGVESKISNNKKD